MQERILSPIGMKRSTFDPPRVRADGDYALPHAADLSGDPRPMALEAEHDVLAPVRPAGGLCSTTREMARFVQTELAGGITPGGTRVVSAENLGRDLALEDGVDELDMVINISALLAGDIDDVEQEVASVVRIAAEYGVTVKAIIEVYFLNDEQIVAAALGAERAGAAFIKTSTGTRPDQQDDVTHAVRLLRGVLQPNTIIKASGGVYNLDAVLAYYEAGARRFGASETAQILDDLADRNAAAQESVSA